MDEHNDTDSHERGFTLRFDNGDWAVILDEDETAAYAYLLHDDEIVADVWLYNVGNGHGRTPWVGGQPPFANDYECFRPPSMPMPDTEGSATVEWEGTTAHIHIDGHHWASLSPGDKPGVCWLSTLPSPVARPMTPTIELGVGDTVTATIVHVVEYGLWLRVGNHTLLVLIVDIAPVRRVAPLEEFSPGERFDVLVVAHLEEDGIFKGIHPSCQGRAEPGAAG